MCCVLVYRSAPWRRGGKKFASFSCICQFLADIYKSIPAGWLPVRLPAINLDTLLRYIMCFAVFRGVKQLWMLAVRTAHSQALSHTAKQQSNRKWELSQGIVNSEPYHEAFVTATALQCNLSMNYKILTSGKIWSIKILLSDFCSFKRSSRTMSSVTDRGIHLCYRGARVRGRARTEGDGSRRFIHLRLPVPQASRWWCSTAKEHPAQRDQNGAGDELSGNERCCCCCCWRYEPLIG